MFFHTGLELTDWFADWVERADVALSPALTDEFDDMRERHPSWFDPEPEPEPRPSPRSRSWSGSVEQWRPLIERYFAPGDVATAMRVMNCETGGTGNPNSYNDRSGASGLFQHLPKYWAARSSGAGWGGADIMDPEANVAVAAWLARQSWFHWTCY